MPFWRGERDPKKLAGLADRRVKQSQAQIEAALTGDYRSELLFVVGQALDNYRQLIDTLTSGKDVIKAYCEIAPLDTPVGMTAMAANGVARAR